jgi:hypothetical protein
MSMKRADGERFLELYCEIEKAAKEVLAQLHAVRSVSSGYDTLSVHHIDDERVVFHGYDGVHSDGYLAEVDLDWLWDSEKLAGVIGALEKMNERDRELRELMMEEAKERRRREYEELRQEFGEANEGER